MRRLIFLSLVTLAAGQPPDDSALLLRTHLGRAIPQHALETILPISVTVDTTMRCFGRVCAPTPMPVDLTGFLRDSLHVQLGSLEAVRTCRTSVPLTCKMPPSRAVLQVYVPIINGDSARMAHSWYDSGGDADSWTHGQEDVYARTGTGWRFVRVNSTWNN
jgi:hypothetical protein